MHETIDYRELVQGAALTNRHLSVVLVQDTWDLSFVVVIAMLLTLITFSTSYDFYLKRNNLPHLSNREHYKRPVDEDGRKLALSFGHSRLIQQHQI